MPNDNITDEMGSLFPAATSEYLGDVFSKKHILNVQS